MKVSMVVVANGLAGMIWVSGLAATEISWPGKSGPTADGNVVANSADRLPTAWDE